MQDHYVHTYEKYIWMKAMNKLYLKWIWNLKQTFEIMLTVIQKKNGN